MSTKSKPKMTIEELQASCPLVTIESTMEKLTGRRNGVVVLQVCATHINSGSMRKFQAAYEKAYSAGLIRGAA